MSLLSDMRILEELARGNIVIDPFDRDQLGTNSYDVRLGQWHWQPNRDIALVNFASEGQSRAFWVGPYKHGGLLIPPGETWLTHTEEIVGADNGFTTAMRARSTIARCGLSICKCAGLGDVGYINRWTLEITNHTHATVALPVGVRVGQIMFYEVGPTLREYDGKYGRDIWTPADMLPRLYADPDIARLRRG